MKKIRSIPNQPRKRKYIRADEENQRILKSKGRELKTAIEKIVIDKYLTDELSDYVCPFLTLEEIIEETKLAEEETLMAVLFEHCHAYMKAGLRAALKEGVPGVLVTKEFAIIDDVEYDNEENEDTLKKWVAGLGKNSKAVGILYVYEDDETANKLYKLANNHVSKTVNGVIDRVKSVVDSAVIHKLPGYSANSNRIKQIQDVKKLPSI